MGEGRESRAALADLARRADWREDAIVDRFAREILPQLEPGELSLDALLVAQGEQALPRHLLGPVLGTA